MGRSSLGWGQNGQMPQVLAGVGGGDSMPTIHHSCTTLPGLQVVPLDCFHARGSLLRLPAAKGKHHPHVPDCLTASPPPGLFFLDLGRREFTGLINRAEKDFYS